MSRPANTLFVSIITRSSKLSKCSLSTELSLNMAINHSAIGIAGIMPNTKTVIKSHPSAKDRDITTIISIAALHAFKVTYHSLSPESYEIFSLWHNRTATFSSCTFPIFALYQLRSFPFIIASLKSQTNSSEGSFPQTQSSHSNP